MEKAIINFLTDLYPFLMDHYQPQGWWPLLSLKKSGINPTQRGNNTGYHPKNYNIPDNSLEIFEVMIGSILMQNTSWVNADKALGNLAVHKILTPKSICDISHDELGQIIRSSGYYNQKASRLQRIARFVSKNPIADLQSKSVEHLRIQLLNIKGVGPETADTILLYALKKPSFVIDAYTRRLLQRLGLVNGKKSYKHYKHLFERAFPPVKKMFQFIMIIMH